MTNRWLLRHVPSEQAVRDIGRQLNDLPPALSRALILREIDTYDRARAFFRPVASDLHDPFRMKDMGVAADRVAQAIREKERMVVYGDYDVDGTTATALLVSSLRSLGGDVDFFVPNRFEHGYGLSRTGLDEAAKLGARLVIAVDCGVTAVAEALYAREKGMDLVVCDHHTPKAELPEAVAVLDPKRQDCKYPFKELAGCSVGFKLLQAVLTKLGRDPATAMDLLDLVAVATASDMVPVEGENRVLLAVGLERLRTKPSVGLRALASVANVSLRDCATSDIVFRMAPRINAAGRVKSANTAIDLLLTDDPEKAQAYAEELHELNAQRRELDQETLESAITAAEHQIAPSKKKLMLWGFLLPPLRFLLRHLRGWERWISSGKMKRTFGGLLLWLLRFLLRHLRGWERWISSGKMKHTLVLHDHAWFPGVIGIVASRLVERFHRPTILLGTIDGVVTGSARSIEGVNIFDALQECNGLLARFGGHAFAAGLSLEISRLPALQKRFDQAVGKRVTPETLRPTIHVDAPLRLDEIDRKFLAVLKQFEPFGPKNDRPVFQANGLLPAWPPRKLGKDGQHLKFSVRQQPQEGHPANAAPIDAIAFGMGSRYDMLEQCRSEQQPFDMLFSVQENTWNGRTTIQLHVKDIRKSIETDPPVPSSPATSTNNARTEP